MVVDGKSAQEYPVNTRVPLGSIIGPIFFLLDINDLPDDVICNIAVDTTFYSKCDKASDVWHLNRLLNLILVYETLWIGLRSVLLISMLGKLNWFRLTDLLM